LIAASLDAIATCSTTAREHQNGLPALTFHHARAFIGERRSARHPCRYKRIKTIQTRTGFLP
jgi:hypothetical protein